MKKININESGDFFCLVVVPASPERSSLVVTAVFPSTSGEVHQFLFLGYCFYASKLPGRNEVQPDDEQALKINLTIK